MDLSVLSELQTLIETQLPHCVTIYMPTYRDTSRHRENRTRLKTLLREAEQQYQDAYKENPEPMLQHTRDLVDDDDFWMNPDEGLVIFIHDEEFKYYRLPIKPPELVVVHERFHIKPLFPLLNENERFYLMAVSQNTVRLFHCSRFTIEELKLEDVPGSLSEALQLEDPEKQLQFHTRDTGVQSTSRKAMFHGQGVVTKEEHKDRILRYFQSVDRALHRYLKEANEPLVFAGVDYLFPLYKEANTYQKLITDNFVSGNMDEATTKQLHQNAMEVMEPIMKKKYENAVQRYQEHQHTESTTDNIEKIVKNSIYSRIDTMFVANDQQRWGRYDPEKEKVRIFEEHKAGSEDLLNFAAIHTVKNGGTVFAVNQENIPGSKPATALYRF